jgi:hypothetical protein
MKNFPEKWAEYVWPDWVPVKVRKEIEEFWAEDFHRGPHEWKENGGDAYSRQRPMGEEVECLRDKVRVKGRWVPAWNNMARLVLNDGRAVVVSTCDILESGWDLEIPCRACGDKSHAAEVCFGHPVQYERAKEQANAEKEFKQVVEMVLKCGLEHFKFHSCACEQALEQLQRKDAESAKAQEELRRELECLRKLFAKAWPYVTHKPTCISLGSPNACNCGFKEFVESVPGV